MSAPRLDPEQRREFVRDVCLAMAGVRSVCEYDQIHAGPIVERIWKAGADAMFSPTAFGRTASTTGFQKDGAIAQTQKSALSSAKSVADSEATR